MFVFVLYKKSLIQFLIEARPYNIGITYIMYMYIVHIILYIFYAYKKI